MSTPACNPARVRAELLRLQAYLLEQRFVILKVPTHETGRLAYCFKVVMDRLQALADCTSKYGDSFNEAQYRLLLPDARAALSGLAELCARDTNVVQPLQQVDGCLQTLLVRT